MLQQSPGLLADITRPPLYDNAETYGVGRCDQDGLGSNRGSNGYNSGRMWKNFNMFFIILQIIFCFFSELAIWRFY